MSIKRSMLLVALSMPVAAGAASADPSGVWRDKDGGTIRVRTCGPAYCATIASVNPPLDPATGKPQTDKNNPDADKRSRPLVGVAVLSAMQPNGPGKWSGTLYDPDRGMTLSGNLVEINANTIRIEGCLFGICGGENLTRVGK